MGLIKKSQKIKDSTIWLKEIGIEEENLSLLSIIKKPKSVCIVTYVYSKHQQFRPEWLYIPQKHYTAWY